MSNQQNLPSFFVPYIQVNVTDEKLKNVFEDDYKFGKISFIDRVLKENSKGIAYYSIYIFFETFNYNNDTNNFLEKSKIKEDPARVYYYFYKIGHSLYWKVLFNTSPRKHSAPAIKVDLKTSEPEDRLDYSHLPRAPCLSNVTIRKVTPMFKPRILREKESNPSTQAEPKSYLLEKLEKLSKEKEEAEAI
jgi:hypothetical protein